ncbi:MAG: T9SS type A sorting domain-containing protein, partial [bacterium]|nr:T9SS type A sorting domain-containing protein [bacterium]
MPRTPAEIVRDLLRDSRTTGGTTSRTPSPESRATVPCSRLPVPELLLPTSLGELRTALPSVYQVSANGTRNEIEAAFQLTDKNIFGITLPNGYNPDHSLRIDPLIYSTALGGSENDYAYGIASDGQGGVYLIGNTESFDFPITAGCYDPSISGGFDIFVTQLNNNGSQLIFSTYLGGFGDECYGAIITDGSFGLIVSGQTNSANFPTTTGVYSRTYNGGPDEYFIAKLDNSGSALLFGTYLGGHHISGCPQLISDGAGGCFVIGSANSDFPSTPNAYDPTFNGGTNDGFFAQLNGNGTQLLYSTFFGGSRNDYCSDFIREANGDFVITGTTNSSDFPVTPNAFDTTYNGHGTGNIGDCFVLKFRLSESRLIYSSYLGGHDEDYESSLTSDNRGGVIVGGRTFSANYPTTANAFDTSKVDEVDDGFVTRLDNTGSQLIYSTFIGGTPNHIGAGSSCYQITNDGNGGALVFGSTASSDFPTTSNAFNFSFNGGFDDCFLSYLDSTGSRLLYSTYLGGGGSDQPRGDIIRDSSGAVILFGDTYQSAGYYNNFPRTSGAFDTSFNIWSDCFIAKLRFDTTSVTIEPTSIPTAFTLHQNYPNPFNSSTTISYSLPKPGNVDVRLFDITGREVATLVNQKQQTGSNRVTFDGKKLSSGTYFVR